MSSKNWKVRESVLARVFGSTRRPLSGNNSKTGGDDSLHETLYLESKHGAQCAKILGKVLLDLINEVRERAAKEGRAPVIGLHHPGSHHTVLLINSKDLYAVCEAFLEVRGLAIVSIDDLPKPESNGEAIHPLPKPKGRVSIQRTR